MSTLVSGAIINSDAAFNSSTCPACGDRIKWSAIPGSYSKDFRSDHAQCGLQFALLAHTVKALVMDEHGNELGDDLTQPESAPVAQEPHAEIANTELSPGGLVMVKVPGQPSS